MDDAFESRFRALFSDAPMFEFTEAGIWVTTPTSVILKVAALINDLAIDAARTLGRPLRIFDAGAGDGRWLYALSAMPGAGTTFVATGVECDPNLAERAAAALAEQPFEVVVGDYFATSEPWPMRDADIVLNYPDGSEQAIADHLAGSHAELWLVSAELNPRIDGRSCALTRKIATASLPWTLATFPTDRSWLSP